MLGKIQDKAIKKLAGILVWTNAFADAAKGIVAILTLCILVQDLLKKFLGIKSPSKLN